MRLRFPLSAIPPSKGEKVGYRENDWASFLVRAEYNESYRIMELDSILGSCSAISIGVSEYAIGALRAPRASIF
jgi:hypothetical protein